MHVSSAMMIFLKNKYLEVESLCPSLYILKVINKFCSPKKVFSVYLLPMNSM